MPLHALACIPHAVLNMSSMDCSSDIWQDLVACAVLSVMLLLLALSHNAPDLCKLQNMLPCCTKMSSNMQKCVISMQRASYMHMVPAPAELVGLAQSRGELKLAV